METLDPNSICNSNLESPNKRLKTQQSSVPCSVDKGKAPIVADDFDESEDDYESPSNSTPESCGICLSEEGKTVRGLIDSCEHYFCFLCIIEWSKVESRCPLCRGRFSSIRRMRKDGSFIGEGSVRVPVRDQIYDPFGQPADPYSQAKCSVCNGTNDECLLLLCDLCDSASHTFCVGLGATVPEGDWYCRDCTVLRAEQHNNEMGDNVVTSTVSPRVNEPSSTSASVSIFDIVRDPDESMVRDSGTDRLLQLVSQRPTNFPSSVVASDRSIIASDRSIPVTRGNLHPSIDASESSARTLRNCRDVRRHINVLRENWDAFRTGSLSFSFAFAESAGKSSERENVVGTSAKRSCTPFSSARASQSNAVDSLCEVTRNKESYNVDRAWKLMNIAKTVQRTDKSKSASKVAPNKAPSIKKNKLILTKSIQSGRRDLVLPKLEKQKTDDNASESAAQSSRKPHFTSFGGTFLGNKHQKSCVNKLSMPREIQTALKANSYNEKSCLASSKNLKGAQTAVLDDGSARSSSSFGPMAEASDVSCTRLPREISAHPVKTVGRLNISVSSKGELQTCQADIGHDKTGLASSANLGRGLSNNSDSFACSTSSNEHVGGDSDASHVNLEGHKKTTNPGKVGAKITSKSNKDDEAKGEIQSLVKLNLKLLSKDKRLGVDEFKEIARLSTHTILASCGFEHRKIVSSLPTLQCHHDDETQQLYRSKIMPNCCRECFYVFVKNVVNSIMSEKLNSAEVAS